MVHYFFGEDTYAAREAIQSVAVEANAEVAWNDAAELTAASLGDSISQTTGLFGSRVTVIVDPSTASKELQEQLAAPNSPSLVLWERVNTDKRSKLWKAYKDKAREFGYPAVAEVATWVQSYVAEREGSIAEPVATRLVARLGRDRWRLSSELDRLLLLDNTITDELVEAETDVDHEGEIFATLDAITSGQQAQALSGLEALLESGNSELYVLSMLAYQYRNLLTVQAGFAEGRNEHDIAREAKLHPFVVSKLIPVSRRYQPAQIQMALTRIAATDFAIKQGKLDARTGITMLVLTLSKPS